MDLQKVENNYIRNMEKILRIENVIGYIKRKRNVILLIIIGFLSYGYFLSTLVTTYIYYAILLLFSFIICLLRNSFKKAKSNYERLKVYFITYLVLYFVFFSSLFCVSKLFNSKIYIVPLNNYSTYKTNAIYFTFCDYKFKRYHYIKKQPHGDVKNKYNIELTLRQPLRHIYFIQYIDVFEK